MNLLNAADRRERDVSIRRIHSNQCFALAERKGHYLHRCCPCADRSLHYKCGLHFTGLKDVPSFPGTPDRDCLPRRSTGGGAACACDGANRASFTCSCAFETFLRPRPLPRLPSRSRAFRFSPFVGFAGRVVARRSRRLLHPSARFAAGGVAREDSIAQGRGYAPILRGPSGFA